MKHRYDRDTCLLCAPASVQNYILDRYRLTDGFKSEYIDHMLHTPENENVVMQALSAIDKYLGTSGANLVTHDGMAGDMIYARYVLGFYYNEYFAYGLGHLSTERRLGFIPEMRRTVYTSVLNPSAQENNKLSQKPVFAGLAREFFKRDSVSVKANADFERFRMFALRHPKFFAKPCWGSLGQGAHIVDTTGFSNRQLRLMFNRLKSVKHGTFCEELIASDSRMAAFHPASVNTMRIVTYLGLDGKARIIGGCIRTGMGGAVVDNTAAGGLYAAVDPTNGLIHTDAVDKVGRGYTTHPETGFVFKGFQTPEWDGLVDVVSRCAELFSRVRLIGWDLALSATRGWQMIEGNCVAHFTSTQACTKRGMRDEFEQAIEWDLNRKSAQTAKT